ncbi:UDP-glucose/GDP-mannose dehydrogenase family protein [Streptomyces sp. H39-S7]|nr:UDP-glucose/GDP-mannose dehydrogenase family protein [Streptomyces sp. H39-S7]MCZ4121696.1 UDP-glucose/GDP-mannose dehydrogenase family protein [Streptomyces sp. H39-S7]
MHAAGEPLEPAETLTRLILRGPDPGGRIGDVVADALAELGHDVLGMDCNMAKIADLNAGKAPFYERDLDALLAEHTASGRLRFTASYAEAAAHADLHFIGVGTPQSKTGNAYDLSQVFTAVRQLAPRLHRPAVIVGKSTVPVGTVPRIVDILREFSPAADRIEVAWNPEFLRESFAIEDTLRPDRIVMGFAGHHSRAETLLRQCYSKIIDAGTPTIVTDLATAELVKSAANAFLATKISFINAMAEVCEATGADVMELAEALGHDTRIGRRGLRPGLGGGCLPKDIRGFMARADELGAHQALAFLREVDAINNRRRERMVDLAREQCDGTLTGKRITIWGAAFKPDTDDIRDSPALHVAQQLHQHGAEVTVSDPKALDSARKTFPELDFIDDPITAAEGTDLLLHLTEWTQYTHIDPKPLVTRVTQAKIIDGRGTLDPTRWRNAGWTYRALGRP